MAVTVPASDLTLLTLDELRDATGVTSGQDAKLAALGRAVASAITSRCNVPAAGAHTPTLRVETLSESFRLECPVDELVLGRRPVTEIVSVTEGGVLLTADEYELHAGAGILYRLCNPERAWWSSCGKTMVVYSAGWASVPENLRSAAKKLATLLWSEGGRDPSLRSFELPDVISKTYWVGPTDDPLISNEIDDLLRDYINPMVG
ncbi:MAG: hypothetical protein WDN48_06025 [Pseudolabrys sp.]